MRRLSAALALYLFMGVSAAEAHTDSLPPGSAPVDSSVLRAAASPIPRPPYRMPPISEALTDHLHNKIIHFPIVMTLIAAGVLLLSRRRPELEPLAFWLVWLSAASVLAAYFSGQAQEEAFHGKPKEWLVEIHEKQGITIGVVQALWVLSLLWPSTRRFAWILGLVAAFLVLTAGYLGGLVAHGH